MEAQKEDSVNSYEDNEISINLKNIQQTRKRGRPRKSGKDESSIEKNEAPSHDQVLLNYDYDHHDESIISTRKLKEIEHPSHGDEAASKISCVQAHVKRRRLRKGTPRRAAL